MNFEKVELFGFKSFADKAEIKFGDGVTCIVGPNGCGKSNVADAIRWVLGEQSAKSLRGKSMQDVIFSGTQSRKALSYCEVSLFFDNSNQIFSSMECAQVIITRKLFGSGESEYYINKQPARMRDIVNLLREVGVGKEGYTIIGQGRVEEIVSAKPEDRRTIFEEATGISKFKSQKDENERRLNRTRENITRLMDIMAEKANRLGPLEKQANKTREYNELTTDLRHHELNTYISKVDNAGADKDKINKRIGSLNDEMSFKTSELDKNEGEYSEMMNEFNSLHKTLSDLNHKYTELCVTAEQRAGQNTLLTTRIGFFNGEIEKAQADIKRNEERIVQNKVSVNDAKEMIAKCKKEVAVLIAEDESLSIEISTLSEKIAVGESLERESNKKIISSIENLADRKQVKSATDTELNNYSERAEELRAKIAGLDDKREKCFNDIEDCDKAVIKFTTEIESIKENIVDAENKVRALNESVAKCDSRIYNLNSTLSTLKAREDFYRSSKNNYEGYNQAVKQLQQRAKTNPDVKKRIVALVGEVISCDKKFDTAIEILLGNAVQNIITETTEDAKYLIAYLKRNDINRLTFLPIDSVKTRDTRVDVKKACSEVGALGDATQIVKYDAKFDRIISSLLGNTLVVDNIDNATKIAEKYDKAFRIVTLEGDVISTQGALTGGSTKKNVHGLLSNDRKIEEVVKQIAETGAEMDALGVQKKKAEEERDEALEALDALEDALNTAKQNKVLTEQKGQSLNQDMAELDVEMTSLKEVLEIVENKITALILRLKTTADDTDALEKVRKDLSVDAEKNSLQAETLKKKKEELLTRQTEIKVSTTALHSRIDALNVEIDNATREIDAIKQSNTLLEKEIVTKQEIIADIKKQQALTSMTDDERLAMNNLRLEIEGIEDRSEELKKLLEERSQKRLIIQEEINGISEKIHLQEISLTKIDTDLEYLEKTVFEDYGATYETAQEEKEEGYDVHFGQEEIQRIRKRRNFLGNINANAIDDYREELASYQELEAQKADLDKAEDDIRTVLETLKAEMVQTFDEGFKQINENFGKIFKELFGGGRAMLELDYSLSEDKLEAGVEIKVEPPGKKMQRLSLLSGGEKSLTAIAILFAILRLKPMAFCVLDEIEAALDEANVDRFARYLKKFSTETQFIVITHRKPTMELADNLFGVTMEEKGVSKLVSVKLSDAVKYDAKV